MQSKFSLSGSSITFTNKGTTTTGHVVENKNGYAVHLTGNHQLPEKKQRALEKRMRDWYYYNHVKKS